MQRHHTNLQALPSQIYSSLLELSATAPTHVRAQSYSKLRSVLAEQSSDWRTVRCSTRANLRVYPSPALKNQSGRLRSQTQLNGHPARDLPHNPRLIQWGRCGLRFKRIIPGTLRRQRFSLVR
jgi:hypothetical protein